jgi:16S rRNA pseudouridine516 synthase
VTIGGSPVKSADEKVAVEKVRVDGEAIECPGGILALLHKPAGCVCSHDAGEGTTIYDLLPARWLARNPPVTSVGRLDKYTTGVLLITDIGELVQRWTSPKHHVAKIYDVTVHRDLDPKLIGVFASGALLLKDEKKPCLPAKLEFIGLREARLELHEGMYHQVKRMFASQGWHVEKLHRSRFGEFEVDGLKPGEWKILPPESQRVAATEG